MSEIKNGGLDQYDAESFEQRQFGTAGVEGVNVGSVSVGGLSEQWVYFIVSELY